MGIRRPRSRSVDINVRGFGIPLIESPHSRSQFYTGVRCQVCPSFTDNRRAGKEAVLAGGRVAVATGTMDITIVGVVRDACVAPPSANGGSVNALVC